jgi:hypothetical protein
MHQTSLGLFRMEVLSDQNKLTGKWLTFSSRYGFIYVSNTLENVESRADGEHSLASKDVYRCAVIGIWQLILPENGPYPLIEARKPSLIKGRASDGEARDAAQFEVRGAIALFTRSMIVQSMRWIVRGQGP